jgi:GTPase SAR1 family protein
MARSLLIIGPPASGKSSSIRNLKGEDTFIITPNTKELPFPGSTVQFKRLNAENPNGNVYVTEDLDDISEALIHANNIPTIKHIIIDDFSHYLTHRVLSENFIDDKGYSKWNVLGASVYQALFSQLDNLREDLTVVIMHHTEIKEDGTVAEKTAGKLMDNTIMVSSWFSVVLHSRVIDKDGKHLYRFQTNKSSIYLAKSPPGMFSELYVKNDLKEVLENMEMYYSGTSKNTIVFN